MNPSVILLSLWFNISAIKWTQKNNSAISLHQFFISKIPSIPIQQLETTLTLGSFDTRVRFGKENLDTQRSNNFFFHNATSFHPAPRKNKESLLKVFLHHNSNHSLIQEIIPTSAASRTHLCTFSHKAIPDITSHICLMLWNSTPLHIHLFFHFSRAGYHSAH